MASLICLNSKNKFEDLRPIQAHNQREDSADKLVVKPNKSPLNYRITETGNAPIEPVLEYEIEYQNIIKHLYKSPRTIRRDATVMCSLFVTSNKIFFENQEEEQIQRFFNCNYEFLRSHFGADRVVDATIHMDERIPHMHFCFVPLTSDGRLSAKAIFDRKGLTLLHAKALASIRNNGFNITKSDDILKPLKMAEDLKRSILLKEIQKLEEKLSDCKSIEISIKSIDEIPFKRSKLPFRDETVIMSDGNFRKIRDIARFGVTAKEDFDKISQENERLHKRYDDHVLLIDNLRTQIKELAENRDELLRETMDMLSTIKSNPHLNKLYQQVKSQREKTKPDNISK